MFTPTLLLAFDGFVSFRIEDTLRYVMMTIAHGWIMTLVIMSRLSSVIGSIQVDRKHIRSGCLSSYSSLQFNLQRSQTPDSKVQKFPILSNPNINSISPFIDLDQQRLT